MRKLGNTRGLVKYFILPILKFFNIFFILFGPKLKWFITVPFLLKMFWNMKNFLRKQNTGKSIKFIKSAPPLPSSGLGWRKYRVVKAFSKSMPHFNSRTLIFTFFAVFFYCAMAQKRGHGIPPSTLQAQHCNYILFTKLPSPGDSEGTDRSSRPTACLQFTWYSFRYHFEKTTLPRQSLWSKPVSHVK